MIGTSTGVQILVAIPHFSSHVIQIIPEQLVLTGSSSSQTVSPSTTASTYSVATSSSSASSSSATTITEIIVVDVVVAVVVLGMVFIAFRRKVPK